VAVEVHPGNYALYDRQQVASGSCRTEDIAGAVVSRLIGKYPHRHEIAVDAGSCAFHKDTGGLKDGTWGQLVQDSSIILKRITQEVGMAGHADGIASSFESAPLGTQLAFFPNHVCMTASDHPRFYVVPSFDVEDLSKSIVSDIWTPCKFW
jgi:D-serine deaminase-like pyridoxal phosphate-dependent protein